MQTETRPILVTGAHRTGTTWVGRLLAADPRVAYVSEPLNVQHRPGVLRARTEYWYTYICPENESEFLPAFRELLAYRYHALAELASLRSGRDVLRMGRDLGIFLGGRLFRKRPLLKDPFAVFSLPWFADRLNCRIVVTIRHPAAFVSSLKRLNWAFDFRDLLRQPLLMRDQLQPFRARMESAMSDTVVVQAAVLWTIVYRRLHAVRERIPAVQVIRHEDLSLDPAGGFRQLYGELGLNFTAAAERMIVDSSNAKNPKELAPGQTHSVKLDSHANLQSWRRRLTSEELGRVRELTEDVARLYYPEVTWN
jgi:hypothetical protein